MPVCPPASLVLLWSHREGRWRLRSCGERVEAQAAHGPGMPTLACLGEASSLAWKRSEDWAPVISAFALPCSIHVFELSWCTLEVNNSNGKSSKSLFIHGVEGEEAEKERRSGTEAQRGSYKGPECGHSPKGPLTTVLGVISEV